MTRERKMKQAIRPEVFKLFVPEVSKPFVQEVSKPFVAEVLNRSS